MGGLNAVHLPQRLQICTSPGLRIDLSWSLLQLEGSSLATSLSVAAWLFWGLGEHLLDRRRTQNHRPGFLKTPQVVGVGVGCSSWNPCAEGKTHSCVILAAPCPLATLPSPLGARSLSYLLAVALGYLESCGAAGLEDALFFDLIFRGQQALCLVPQLAELGKRKGH